MRTRNRRCASPLAGERPPACPWARGYSPQRHRGTEGDGGPASYSQLRPCIEQMHRSQLDDEVDRLADLGHVVGVERRDEDVVADAAVDDGLMADRLDDV